MPFFLSQKCSLKWLETPSVYNIETDELYNLDYESFEFLKACSSDDGGHSDDRKFTEYCIAEGILITEKVSVRRPPLVRSLFPSLRYLELQITDRCNLKCRHCYIDEEMKSELSSDEIKKALCEFEKMQGLRLLITGGEPLLHRQFAEINDMLPMFSFRKVLLTNGTLIKKALLRGLNVHEIQISIDGLEDAHDLLRGKGNFRASLCAIRDCLQEGVDVSVSTMVHRANLHDFDAMEKLFRELGIRDWTVDVPCPAGRMEFNKELQIRPEEGGGLLSYGHGGGIHGGEPGYACGLHLASVSAGGKVSKCTFYSRNPAGSVAEGLDACWQRIIPVRLDTLKCECEHLEVCRGGCRYRAEILEGPLGRDLYRCSLYDIMESG